MWVCVLSVARRGYCIPRSWSFGVSESPNIEVGQVWWVCAVNHWIISPDGDLVILEFFCQNFYSFLFVVCFLGGMLLCFCCLFACFLFLSFETGFLCLALAGFPEFHSVDRVGLEVKGLPASVSGVLRFKTCATTAPLKFLFKEIIN